MSEICGRVAYLKGLAEGMGLDKSTNENKLLLEIISVLDDMAKAVKELEEDVDEMDEYIESIDDDLSDMEEAIFGDEDDMDDDGDEDDDEFDEDDQIEFDCPSCGVSVEIKASDIDFEQSPVCPKCGSPFFPDVTDDAEDDEDEDE